MMHEKLVGGEDQLPKPAGLIGSGGSANLTVARLPGLEKFPFVIDLQGARLFAVERSIFFG
jgi:hypothetical protein